MVESNREGILTTSRRRNVPSVPLGDMVAAYKDIYDRNNRPPALHEINKLFAAKAIPFSANVLIRWFGGTDDPNTGYQFKNAIRNLNLLIGIRTETVPAAQTRIQDNALKVSEADRSVLKSTPGHEASVSTPTARVEQPTPAANVNEFSKNSSVNTSSLSPKDLHDKNNGDITDSDTPVQTIEPSQKQRDSEKLQMDFQFSSNPNILKHQEFMVAAWRYLFDKNNRTPTQKEISQALLDGEIQVRPSQFIRWFGVSDDIDNDYRMSFSVAARRLNTLIGADVKIPETAPQRKATRKTSRTKTETNNHPVVRKGLEAKRIDTSIETTIREGESSNQDVEMSAAGSDHKNTSTIENKVRGEGNPSSGTDNIPSSELGFPAEEPAFTNAKEKAAKTLSSIGVKVSDAETTTSPSIGKNRGILSKRRDRQEMAQLDEGNSPEMRTLQMFEEHNRVLRSVAMKLMKNPQDAEDLMHDTFVLAMRGIEGFNGNYSRAWLIKIMSNRAMDIFSYRSRRPAENESDLYDPDDPTLVEHIYYNRSDTNAPNLADRVVERVDAQAHFEELIYNAKRYLTPDMLERYMRLIYGRAIGELYREMAEIVGVAEGTIKSTLSRGDAAMRLAQRDIEEAKAA